MNAPSSPDSSPDPSSSSGWMRALREVAPYLDIGWRIAGALAVLIGGGYLLDRWWGTLPWLTIAGAVLGMASVFVQIYRIGEQLGRRSNAASSRRSSGRSADRSADDAS